MTTRVILVGRTGLDASLRTDPELELVRAPTLLDAVGELSHAAEPGASSVVVVGRVPIDEHASVPDAVLALRRVDPEVVVVASEPGACPGLETLGPSRDGRAIREVGRRQPANAGSTRPPSATPAPVSSAPVSPAPVSIAPVSLALVSTASDSALVAEVVHGRDPLPIAIELVRARAGASQARFVSGAGGPGVPVEWRGRRLGAIVADAPDEVIRPHAGWLAAWLVLHEQQAQLREAAFTDSLTGAHNRRFLDQFLRGAMETAREHRRTITLLMFDIDNFKSFNDRFGHPAGDEILRQTVKLLRSVIRPTDKVCRIGGDEFAVIFHEPDGPRTPTSKPPESIASIAARFQRQVAQHRFPKLGIEAPGALCVSGGLATYPWDGLTAEELLDAADRLVLQSKRQGKNAILLGPGAERTVPSADAPPV